jgi:hypothetical protein
MPLDCAFRNNATTGDKSFEKRGLRRPTAPIPAPAYRIRNYRNVTPRKILAILCR